MKSIQKHCDKWSERTKRAVLSIIILHLNAWQWMYDFAI
jgi:hypothetical protein